MLQKRIKYTTLLALVFGFMLTLATMTYRTTTTQNQVVGSKCNGVWCDDPLPQAGFPFVYLRDSLGTSVEGSLGPEDTFLFDAFLIDWSLAVLIVWLPLYFLARKK
ncbi:MAG: hypothetical protein NUV84_02545 [Candidatus Uhrbacteria bacterium]|nr:hypothetical protein [Candidatus Uhrbacteria bacterium]